MSEQTSTESRSSVKITTNAKGEAQIEVKVYDDDVAQASLTAATAVEDTIVDLTRRGIKVAGGAA